MFTSLHKQGYVSHALSALLLCGSHPLQMECFGWVVDGAGQLAFSTARAFFSPAAVFWVSNAIYYTTPLPPEKTLGVKDPWSEISRSSSEFISRTSSADHHVLPQATILPLSKLSLSHQSPKCQIHPRTLMMLPLVEVEARCQLLLLLMLMPEM